jgi:hypothetical protein
MKNFNSNKNFERFLQNQNIKIEHDIQAMYQVHVITNMNSLLDSFQFNNKYQICRGRKADTKLRNNTEISCTDPAGKKSNLSNPSLSNSQASASTLDEDSNSLSTNVTGEDSNLSSSDEKSINSNSTDPDFICIIGEDPTDGGKWIMAIEVKNPWIDYEGPFDQNEINLFDGKIDGEFEQVIIYMQNYNLKYSVLTNFMYHWFFKFENGMFYITKKLDLNAFNNKTIYEWLFVLINDNQNNPLKQDDFEKLKVKN